jgi:hypothetical protein
MTAQDVYIFLVFSLTFLVGVFFMLKGIYPSLRENWKRVLLVSVLTLLNCFVYLFIASMVRGYLKSTELGQTMSYLSYLLIFLTEIPLLKFSVRSSWPCAMIFVSIAYCFQHLCQYIYQLILTPMGFKMFSVPGALIRVAVTVVYSILFYLMIRKKIANVNDEKISKRLLVAFVSVVSVLATIILNSIAYNDAMKLESDHFVYYTLVFSSLVALLAIVLDIEILDESKLIDEVTSTKKILHSQKSIYETEKEVIDSLNIKSHDLKHQIHSMKPSITEDAYQEIDKIISEYDSFVHTGNKALDTVLIEKGILCKKDNIRFTFLIRGESLSFIRENDIYSLFGNILDNAIEAVLKLPNEEYRVISISEEEKNGEITLRCMNYFDGNLVQRNGEIQTTKDNKIYHGYGLKSIRYITQKYQGNVAIRTDADIFELALTFPKPLEPISTK